MPTSPPNPRYDSAEFRLAFSRTVTHYFGQCSCLEDGAVLRDAPRLADIRGIVVQGRLDLGNLLGTPWRLALAWPGCELVLVDETGHGGSAAMTAPLVAATDSVHTGS